MKTVNQIHPGPFALSRIGDRGIMRKAHLLVLLALAALLAGTSDARADRRLSGTVGAIVIDDNAFVPAGATVTLNGTIIRGNLFVRSRATLIANGVRVSGNIQSDNGRTKINIQDRSYVEGNVQVLNETTDSTGCLRIYGSVIDGDVQATKYRGMIAIAGNRVGGNIQLVENWGDWSVLNNMVRGDLQAFKNRSRAPGEIRGNWVGGNIQTGENYPAAIVSENSTEG